MSEGIVPVSLDFATEKVESCKKSKRRSGMLPVNGFCVDSKVVSVLVQSPQSKISSRVLLNRLSFRSRSLRFDMVWNRLASGPWRLFPDKSSDSAYIRFDLKFLKVEGKHDRKRNG